MNNWRQQHYSIHIWISVASNKCEYEAQADRLRLNLPPRTLLAPKNLTVTRCTRTSTRHPQGNEHCVKDVAKKGYNHDTHFGCSSGTYTRQCLMDISWNPARVGPIMEPFQNMFGWDNCAAEVHEDQVDTCRWRTRSDGLHRLTPIMRRLHTIQESICICWPPLWFWSEDVAFTLHFRFSCFRPLLWIQNLLCSRETIFSSLSFTWALDSGYFSATVNDYKYGQKYIASWSCRCSQEIW